MSEEKNDNKSLSLDNADNDTINPPSSTNQTDDDHTHLSSDKTHSTGTRRAIDPMKDTTVFSPNDRRLKRILNHQNDDNPGTVALGNKHEVILLIRGMIERIVLEVGHTHRLGRFELGATTSETDLTPYGAQDRGVSRIHAELKIIDGVVHIVDLGSTNGTFVNTRQLESDTPVPLRKGDELLLGHLAMQILFQ
ncbi:MAG: FHA domain-containing protein [Anaerolineae bacterium]